MERRIHGSVISKKVGSRVPGTCAVALHAGCCIARPRLSEGSAGGVEGAADGAARARAGRDRWPRHAAGRYRSVGGDRPCGAVHPDVDGAACGDGPHPRRAGGGGGAGRGAHGRLRAGGAAAAGRHHHCRGGPLVCSVTLHQRSRDEFVAAVAPLCPAGRQHRHLFSAGGHCGRPDGEDDRCRRRLRSCARLCAPGADAWHGPRGAPLV